jgi:mono/diheme cytochrome c family protein
MEMRLFLMLSFVLTSFFVSEKIGDSNYHYIQEKKASAKSIAQGKQIYQEFCIQCHLGNGKGTAGVIPILDNSDYLTKKRKESIHAVKFGQSGPIIVNGKKYNGNMPPMGLNDQEVADVMNYIMNSWSNKQKKEVTIEEVGAVKK